MHEQCPFTRAGVPDNHGRRSWGIFQAEGDSTYQVNITAAVRDMLVSGQNFGFLLKLDATGEATSGSAVRCVTSNANAHLAVWRFPAPCHPSLPPW
jgi:hypothetical protein